MSMKWLRDEAAVHHLETLGIKYRREAVSIKDVIVKESMANMARIVPLDVDLVKQYADAMRNGDIFPEIVVRETDDGLVIAGGNHRFQAALANNEDSLVALVVNCSDMEFDLLAKTLNQLNGRPPTPAEAVLQAAAYVRLWGISAKRAAAAFKVASSSVQSELNAEDMRQAARKHKLPISGWTTTTLSTLKSLSELESVKIAILRGCAGYTPKQTDLFDLKHRLSEQGTEAEKLTEVESWLASRAKQKTQRAVFAPIRAAINGGVTQIENRIAKASVLSQTQLSPEEAEEIVKRLRKIADVISRLVENGSASSRRRSG